MNSLIAATSETPKDDTLVGIFIVLGIFVLLIVLIVLFIKKAKKKRLEKKQVKKQQARQEEIQRTGIYAKTFLTHVSGLPIAASSVCNLVLTASDLQISVYDGGTSINLPVQKISDVSQKTDLDIRKSYTSSAGGAVAGGMMFGAAGALIGGRTKEITQDNSKTYLIIVYRDDVGGETKSIVFDATSAVDYSYGKMKDFKKRSEDYKYLVQCLHNICKNNTININL